MASRLQDVILRGTAASRPTATTVAPGTLYYSTDTAVTERCADTGLTWETYSDGGTAGAPTGASYVTLATNGTLTSERVLTAGTGITLTDAGAGSTVTIAASGGSSGLVLLEQHTASASASLDFTSCISSTYDDYQIELVMILPTTNNVDLYLRMSTNGGSSYDAGGNYAWTDFRAGTSGGAAGGSTAQTQIVVSGGGSVSKINSTASGGGLSGTYHLKHPASTASWKSVHGTVRMYSNDPLLVVGIVVGDYRSTTAVNAFQFLMSSGTIASGTVRVYGLAK